MTALIAIVISSVFPGLLMLPVSYNITARESLNNNFAANTRFIFSACVEVVKF